MSLQAGSYVPFSTYMCPADFHVLSRAPGTCEKQGGQVGDFNEVFDALQIKKICAVVYWLGPQGRCGGNR